jgi:hypothetical protein
MNFGKKKRERSLAHAHGMVQSEGEKKAHALGGARAEKMNLGEKKEKKKFVPSSRYGACNREFRHTLKVGCVQRMDKFGKCLRWGVGRQKSKKQLQVLLTL